MINLNYLHITFSYDLMMRCWMKKPEERLPFEEIKQFILRDIG
jgi:hypothetical protein